MINSYAIYIDLQSCLKEIAIYCPLRGFTTIGLPSENHHKTNLITGEMFYFYFFIEWRCCLPLVDHFLNYLVQRLDPQLAIVIGQNQCVFGLNISVTQWTTILSLDWIFDEYWKSKSLVSLNQYIGLVYYDLAYDEDSYLHHLEPT